MNDWKKITVEYPNRCIQCKVLIEEGEEALYMQKVGLKHEECPTDIPQKDETRLIIITDEDRKLLG